jgi:signal transduction histidine kinase
VADERLMVVLVESLAAGVAPMQEEEVAVKEREVHDGITVHHNGMSWGRRLG